MAQFLLDLDRDIRKAEAELEKMKDNREAFSADLADRLGVGGAVFVNDGHTVAYVANGTRALDKDALHRLVDAHEGTLPTTLLPRPVATVKYPSVAEVDKAAAFLSALGVNAEDLVTYRGRRHVVRFREMEDE